MQKEKMRLLCKPLLESSLAILALLFGLCLTGWVYHKFKTVELSEALGRAADDAKEYQRTLESGLDMYLNFNRNVAAFIGASKQVTHAEFHNYMQALGLPDAYPATLQIAYVPRVAKSGASEFESKTRRLFPSFKLHGRSLDGEYILSIALYLLVATNC